MANLITLFRLALVYVIGALALYAPASWKLLNVPLIIIAVLLDGLDGIIARKRHESSIFGAVFDIAADRITEIALWIILAEIGMVSVWIAIIFLTRGILVDSIRKHHANQGKLPFSIMRTSLSKFLVASRTMRFASGFFKLLAFSWLFFLLPAVEIWPQTSFIYREVLDCISNVLISAAVITCLARGIPVILEALVYKQHSSTSL